MLNRRLELGRLSLEAMEEKSFPIENSELLFLLSRRVMRIMYDVAVCSPNDMNPSMTSQSILSTELLFTISISNLRIFRSVIVPLVIKSGLYLPAVERPSTAENLPTVDLDVHTIFLVYSDGCREKV